MFEIFGGLLAALASALTIWKLWPSKAPILHRYTLTPCFTKGMVHVSLTLKPRNSPVTVIGVSCPGHKLHHCPSTCTGFTLASPDRFTDSLSFDVDLEPGKGSRDISFLISPISQSNLLIELRISEITHPIAYTVTQRQSAPRK